MSVCIALRNDYDGGDLRRLAKRCRDPRQLRRLLALAAAYDGMSRTEAAKVGGMDRQTLRDWAHRFNEDGPDGLTNRAGPTAGPEMLSRVRAALIWRGSYEALNDFSCDRSSSVRVMALKSLMPCVAAVMGLYPLNADSSSVWVMTNWPPTFNNSRFHKRAANLAELFAPNGETVNNTGRCEPEQPRLTEELGMFRTAFLIASITLFPAVADAAPCGERIDFINYFEAKYAETPVSMGLTSDGKLLEILTSDQGTWTIIVTTPSGESCGIVSGEAWSKITPLEKLPGEAGL